MSSPDVRVRLSAEGVQEVVDALKRIQAEAQKTSTAATKTAASGKAGFAEFGRALAGVGDLLAAFGVTISIGAMVDLAKQAIDSADAIKKLRERLGGTIEEMSALSVGARLAHSSNEALEAGMGQLARRIQELRAGSATARAEFAGMGLSARSFRGKDLAQDLVIFARALKNVSDDGTRTAKVEYTLGKGARELSALLDEIGTSRGLDVLKEKAASLGLLINGRIVDQAQQLGDGMKILGEQVRTVAVYFVAGFGEGALGSLQDYEKSLGGAASGFEMLGRVVAQFVNLVYGLAKAVTAPIALLLARITVGFIALWDQASLAMRGHFAEAAERGRLYEKQIREMNEHAWRDIKGGLKTAFTIPSVPSASGADGGGTPPPSPEEAYQLRAETLKAALENEKRIHDAQLALRERNEESSYQRSLTTIRDHYAARRKMITDGLAWEIAALLRQRAVAGANPDKDAGQREQRSIDAQIKARRLQAQGQLADLGDKEIADVRRTAETRLSYERKILDAQGNRYASTLRGLEEEKRRLAENLRLQGLTASEISRQVDAYDRAMTDAANYEQARTEADTVMARFTSERARIQSDVDAGLLTQLEGEDRILALERQRLPGLREMADALTRAAEATDNPEAIQQAKAFADGLRHMGESATAAEKSMKHLKDDVAQAFQGSLSEYFSSGINEAHSFGEAMEQLAVTVASAMQRIAAEKLALKITDWLFGGFSGGGKVAAKKAAGGYISGPGTGTSDSIPAWLSAGEYVVRAAAVSQPGMLQHLEAINAGMQRIHVEPLRLAPIRFADGGIAGAAAGKASVDGRVTVELGDGLVGRVVEHPDFSKGVLRIVGKNPRAIRGMLGN